MATSIKLDARKYVVGMNWEFVDPLELGERVKALRTQLGPKGLIALRKHRESVSLGTAPDHGSQNIGGASLALAIADCHEQPWMGIFEIPALPGALESRYWYIAISREQSIVSSSDKVGTREEMEALRNEYMGLGEWQVLEGGIDDLKARLRDARAKHKTLYPVRQLKPDVAKWLLLLTVIVTLSAGCYLGFRYYEKIQEAKRLRLLAMERAALMARRRAREQTVIKTVPWSTYPRIDDLIFDCSKAVEALPLDLNGWRPIGTGCTGTGMSVTWQRDDFGSVANAPGPLSGGDKANSHVGWVLKGEKGSLSDLILPYELTGMMYRMAQKADVKLNAGAMNTQPVRHVPVKPGQKPPPPPPYLPHTFTFTVDSLEEMSVFSKVPTARITFINVIGLPDKKEFMVHLTVWSKN